MSDLKIKNNPKEVREPKKMPKKGRIRVLVDFPHVRYYGHKDTLRELVYGCDFKVAVGDKVLCPPTALYSAWSTGVVVALDGGGYNGPVKKVKKYRDGKKV